MLNALVQFSLRRRGVVVILAGILLVYGILVAYRSRLDVFPEFVPPQVVVQTEAPGLSPEQVEVLVTTPVEVAISGLGGMQSLRSESIQGLSIITAVFEEGTDVFRARQTLAESLAELAGGLAAGVKAPRMTPLTSSTMDLLKIGLVSDTLSPEELRSFAMWTLRPRLLAVPGVAKASLFGGEIRQLQIQVLSDRLEASGLAVTDVLAAAQAATGVLGAGFVDTGGQRIVLQTEGQALMPEALAAAVIEMRDGVPIRLGDVARVVEGGEPKYGDTLVQGGPGVLITMSSQYGANTLEVTHALEAALDELAPVFEKEGITVYPRLHRPATFIEAALRNIRHSLLLGGVLVAAVLFLFLGHVRTALISLTAIPLSLLGAVIGLDALGVTLNTITIGGLAIALGEVVDDAIIDVENIFRRLRENQTAGSPRPALRVVLDASLEVRNAVVFATFVVVLVFLPVLALTGLQGSFFSPLALSYILAILTSLLVALTVTPALSLLFFGGGVRSAHEPRLQTTLKAHYRRLLLRISRHRGPVIVAVAVLCALALARIPFLGGGFLPEFREGHFVLQVSSAPGTSLEEMMRVGGRISRALLAQGDIATVEQQVGRAELGEDPWGPHRSEFHVDLKPVTPAREAEIADEIRDILAKVPGVQSEVLTFLGDRIGETLTGETAAVVVDLYGDDLDVLDRAASLVSHALSGVSGATDVQVKAPPGAPRISIRLRPERLTPLGFRAGDVLAAVQTAYQGTVVAQTYRGNQVADVVVILDEHDRHDPERIGALRVRSPGGARVPLRELAEIELTDGRYEILHDGARRRQTVTCNVSGRAVSDFVREAKRAVAEQVTLPRGAYLEFHGAAEAQAEASRELFLNASVAGVGIVLLLSVVLGHWRNLLLVVANLPFALVGGVFAASLTAWLEPGEGGLSMGAMVGFVTLFGITTRNSIMMLSHFDHLVSVDGLPWNLETAVRGASERLIPILMTALVTSLGLLPLAIGSGAPGREIEGPMAIVIMGGLVTSTALNLLVLPTLALRAGHFRR